MKPVPSLAQVRAGLRGDVKVASQDLNEAGSGAYTGDLAPAMIKDSGLDVAIVGHSERRAGRGETNDVVGLKTKAGIDAGLQVIACIGETLEQREAGQTLDVLTEQLAGIAKHVSDWTNVVVAYEPVWAIGTGVVATPEQAQEVHAGLRQYLATNVSQQVSDSLRILYGGSVTASNASELAALPDVDGFLVGGASLKPEFVDIVNAGSANPEKGNSVNLGINGFGRIGRLV